jgi:hypothetical protein
MGKSAPSPPTPPDPVATAQAQGAINRETAIAQANLNRINEFTPYGSSVWEQQPEAPRTFTPKWESVPVYGERTWIEGAGDDDDGQWSEPEIIDYKQVQTNLEPDPVDPTERRWERTATLDPAQQEIVDRQNQVIRELNRVAGEQVGRVGTALSDPFSYEGIIGPGSADAARAAAQRASGIADVGLDYAGQPAAPTSQGIRESADIAAGSVADPFSLSGVAPSTAGISGAADIAEAGMAQPFNYTGLPGAFDTQGAQAAVQTATDAYGNPLDYSGAPAAPLADAAARQQVIDSVYGQHTSRLDPRFAGEQIAMETKLANSGIARGTRAFSAAMDDFYRGKNDAYQGARNAAIQAGGAEQSRLFGLGSAARRDAIAEQNYLRALPGQEQGQLLGYQGQLAGLQTGARGRAAQERLTERGLPISEAAQLQQLRGTEFDASSAARGRSVQEQLLQRGMPAQEQAQIQAMRGTAYDAQAQDRARALQEQAAQRAIPFAEQQQVYNMQQGLFGLDQQARQRAIEESAYLRNLPLNETSALLSGNQIQNPQFGAAPRPAVAGTDYAGLVASNYAGQMNAYNQQVAAQNARTGAIGGMIGTLGAAAIRAPVGTFSDRRIKQNISKVGVLDNGLPVYSFQYIWGGPQQIGLMAQDVEKVNPSAVVENDAGVKMVNYSEAVKAGE